MESRYIHKDHEEKIYQKWEESGEFSPTNDPTAQPYCIIMPPPNANDPLHVGHAMFVTIEDILIRYARMKGKAVLWLPGSDHAGIETQFVFEKKLREQGKSRFDFDRETLFQMIWEYVQENSGVAVEQLKKLGASADWSRFCFTLDPAIVEDVVETFVQMNKDDLVYRDLRLVNYCTKCGTAFSELEVDHVERNAPLYYMKYGPFTLATVRPETKFGDTGIAVHPDDIRYREYVGKEVEVEGLLGKFKMVVVADEFVDPEFGTGVVKITPAHDPNDFEVWQRHQGEIPGPKQVIGFDGKMTEAAGKYAGLSVEMARKQVVEDLETKGLLVKVDKNYKHNVGTCYRCGKVIEPLPLAQFFIRTKGLTDRVLEAMEHKEVGVLGAGHDKILRHWLETLHDWNISRQIVWGIRMPVWYEIEAKDQHSIPKRSGGNSGNTKVVFINAEGEKVAGDVNDLLETYNLDEIKAGLQSIQAPMEAKFVVSPFPPGDNYLQETDTFDTWFSSSQWPYVTLQNTQPDDFERFYPTQVMETAYDILMFWVMRMLMMGYYRTGKTPFTQVYLHGLIRDERGQKMSKSKGNAINPLEVTSEYGADALRMALVIRSTPGLDKNVGVQDFKAMRNLTNKIWNASRYVMMTEVQVDDTKKDKEFLSTLSAVVGEVSRQLDELRVGLAAETIYNQFWHWYCDVGIEQNKKGEVSKEVLVEGLITFLKLLHPFVPFVTEAVYQELKDRFGDQIETEEFLMTSRWPENKG